MATTTKEQGNSSQFVDTVGAFTETHGGSTFSLSYFEHGAHLVNNHRDVGNDSHYISGTDVANALGTDLFQLYQHYKINSFEFWITGTNAAADQNQKEQLQCSLVEWNLPLAVSSGAFASLNAEILPGCKWKSISLPQYLNSESAAGGTYTGPGDQNVLSGMCRNPIYQINVFGVNTPNSGNKVASDPLPTYSSRGIDVTPWGSIIFQWRRILGELIDYDWYYSYTYKVNITFSGLRLQGLGPNALSVSTKPDTEYNRCIIRGTVKGATSPFSHGRQNSLGTDSKKRTTAVDIHGVRREGMCEKSSRRAKRDERRRRRALALLPTICESPEESLGGNIRAGIEEHVATPTGSTQRIDGESEDKIPTILLERRNATLRKGVESNGREAVILWYYETNLLN